MGPYSGASPFDKDVEKATSDSSTETNWEINLNICDKVQQSSSGPKDCLLSIMKRLGNKSKQVQLHTLTLLDTCVQNCGLSFHKQMACSEFVQESRSFLQKAESDVAEKFKELVRKWAESEFKSDSSLSVIPNFFNALRQEGAYFGMGVGSNLTSKARSGNASSSSSNTSASKSKEEEELAKAIEISLKEAEKDKKTAKTSSLYPSMSGLTSTTPASVNTYSSSQINGTEKLVRARYDFEAAEDNELTFTRGEVITILDDSDANWYMASSWRGKGLIPANFVTTDLSEEPVDENSESQKHKKSVQFNEDVEVQQFDPDKVEISEQVVDKALDLIQNADPTGVTEDSQEMLQLEEECKVMGPLIDQELEQVDKRHNELMTLNQKLIDSFQLYTQLMQEATSVPSYTSMYTQQQQPGTMPAPQTQQQTPHMDSNAMLAYYNQATYMPGVQQPITQDVPHTSMTQPQYSQAPTMDQYQNTSSPMGNPQYISSSTGPPQYQYQIPSQQPSA